jgi:dienelactone hydrolase
VSHNLRGKFVAVLYCCAGISLSACTVATFDPTTALEPGAYEVAYDADIVLTDPADAREVRVQVSRPVLAADDDDQFPLVVFSHGAFCYPQQYRNITDFWVSHGYIVVLPNHLDSPNLGKIKPGDLSRLQESRIQDMSLVLDSLAQIETALPDITGHIDPQRAAVAGHSFGGMIAMVKAGLTMQDAAGDVMQGYTDPRFSAAIVMSGVGLVPPMPNMPNQAYMTDNAFDGLTGPLLANGGSLDTGNVGTGVVYPWEWRLSGYTLAPPGDKYGLAIQDADHYFGGLICRDNRGGPADPASVEVVRATQRAFLDTYLKGDQAAGQWLRSADFAALSNNRAQLDQK